MACGQIFWHIAGNIAMSRAHDHALPGLPSSGPRVSADRRALLWRPQAVPQRTAVRMRGASVRSFAGLVQADTLADAVEGSYEAWPRPIPSAGATYGLSFTVLAARLPEGATQIPFVLCTQERLERLVFNVLEGGFSLVVISADLGKYAHTYGRRGHRYAALEAGHFAQAFLMDVFNRGWAACPVGGFHDGGVAELSRRSVMDASEPLYLLGVGYE
jgi:Nitroreductase family